MSWPRRWRCYKSSAVWPGCFGDPLAGPTNRRGFDDALQELTGRPDATFAAALLDLDHVKQVNDTGGHQAGDRLLRRVATVWSAAVPPLAVLARLGGASSRC